MLRARLNDRFPGSMVLDRSFWIAVGVTSYVALAGLQGSSLTGLMVVGLALGPIALWELWRQTRRRLERTLLAVELAWATRIVGAASVSWIQARLSGTSSLLVEVVATLALATTSVGALYAIARIERLPGLIPPVPRARSLDAAAFAAFLWAAVLVVVVARFTDVDNRFGLDPLTLDYAQTTACTGTLLLFAAAGWRTSVLRKLELGVPERAVGAIVASLVSLCVSVPATVVNVGPPDRVMPAAVLFAAAAVMWTAQVVDPARIFGVMRAMLVALFLGSPIALFLGGLAESSPQRAPLLILLATVLALLVGALSRRAAVPLAPVQARWLEALEDAMTAALVPEPTAAVVATLRALKQAFRSPKASPQLWRVDPPATLSVDVAGYLSEVSAKVPSAVYELALQEPERTLRRETIAALQVTRADLRGLMDWFDVRNAHCATALVDADEPIGFLLMPRADRNSSLTLEEARALNQLGQRLSGLLGVTATLARARSAEMAANKQVERWQKAHDDLAAAVQGTETRHQLFARHLARSALSTAYSPRARETLAALETWPASPQAHVMLCPPGVDPKPWAAVAHLGNRSGAGPFLVVDAGYARADNGVDWDSPVTSPFVIARGGTLFIQDAHLLTEAVQVSLTRWLTQVDTADTSTLPPCRVLLSFGCHERPLLPSDVLPALVTLLPRTPVLLPRLSERPEDLRALVLDSLSRMVSSRDGAPLGIDRQALQYILDHDWPGNEDELRDALHRGALHSDGPQLRGHDLRACGFLWAGAEDPALDQAPHRDNPPPRRRRAHVQHPRGRKV